MRKPFGIYIITMFAALFSLPQLKNMIEVFLLPIGLDSTGTIVKFIFSGIGFILAATWAVFAFKMRKGAFFISIAFFGWSLLPFLLVIATIVSNQEDASSVFAFLPYMLIWGALVLSLVLWTRKLIDP